MNILVASDSFKGTLSSLEVGMIIKKCLSNQHHIEVMPISDGGEGLIDALAPVISGNQIEVLITDPLKRPIVGAYYLSEDKKTAIIESAIACGLGHLKFNERNPLKTTSYGVGELIKHAINHGASKLIIGIGGSGTNDAGIGLLEALGVEFFDEKNELLTQLVGEDLNKINSMNTSKLEILLQGISIEVACDVDNILLGKKGATYTFGPQKGATMIVCNLLEQSMMSFVEVVEKTIGKTVRNRKGVGAAGGIGMCLLSFLNAELKPGIELILDASNFNSMLKNVDLIITGEGKIDYQTAHGKVVQGVSRRCREHGKTLYAVCGVNDSSDDVLTLFDEVFSIVPTVASIEEALESPNVYLEELVENYIKKNLLDHSVS